MTDLNSGSVEERVDQLQPHADSESNLFAKAFGMLQVIGEIADMPGSVRVRLARNVLTAAERVRMGDDPTGQLYGRGDEGQDPQPIAGRVPAHLEDGVTGQVEMVESGAEPRCTPACDAQMTDPSITGLARGWHSDDCPVAVYHHADDGITECGIPVADLPPAHGYGYGANDDAVDCVGCLAALKALDA